MFLRPASAGSVCRGILDSVSLPSLSSVATETLRASSSLSSSLSSSSPSSSSSSPAAAWDWAFVVGAKPGRKPAIKRPQRHQWLYCNPTYDPNKPMPAKISTPHAPRSAAETDDWRLFNAAFGGKANAQRRKEFVRYLHLRDVDWRNAFHRGLAGEYTARMNDVLNCSAMFRSHCRVQEGAACQSGAAETGCMEDIPRQVVRSRSG